MKQFKNIVVGLVLSTILLPVMAAQNYVGKLERINQDKREIVVNGKTYIVPLDAQVTVGGKRIPWTDLPIGSLVDVKTKSDATTGANRAKTASHISVALP